MLDKEEVERIARQRQNIHDKAGNTTERFFKDRLTEDRKGVAGELQFELETGYVADRSISAYGDKGYDFDTPIGKIDVKVASKPFNLLIKEWEIGGADYYVLGKYFDDGTVEFIGWETCDEMRNCPVRDFGYGIKNYYKSAKDLKPWIELKNKLIESMVG